jgi:Cu-Zn family superoxide dismutase
MNSGIAVFQGPEVYGTVRFEENNFGTVSIYINLSGPGLQPNKLQGFHIHEYGDLSEGCKSACAHYNPFGKSHGCPGALERHVGDLGNLKIDLFGRCNYSTTDDTISLRGDYSIIGRTIIIHKETDDCGTGQGEHQTESLKTGNAGDRIACAVIGYASPKNCLK